MGSWSELIWLRIGADGGACKCWDELCGLEKVGNCWSEDRFGSYEGLCSVALVRLVSLVSQLV